MTFTFTDYYSIYFFKKLNLIINIATSDSDVSKLHFAAEISRSVSVMVVRVGTRRSSSG